MTYSDARKEIEERLNLKEEYWLAIPKYRKALQVAVEALEKMEKYEDACREVLKG